MIRFWAEAKIWNDMEDIMMRKFACFVAVGMIGLVVAASPALAGGRRVFLSDPVYGPMPVQTVYTAPVATAYAVPMPTSYVTPAVVMTGSPIGPTAYVTPAPVIETRALVPARAVRVRRASAFDQAVLPTSYQVVPPRRIKFLYPRRVYGRGY